MRLTQQQIDDFNREGWLFLPELFSREEVALLAHEAEAIYDTERPEVWREKSGAPRTAFAAHLYNEAFGLLGAHPRMIDPVEQDFSFVDSTLFKGLENLGEQLTEPRALRAAYLREFEGFLKALRSGARDLHMDYVLMRTDQPLEVALHEFLSRRMHKAGRR